MSSIEVKVPDIGDFTNVPIVEVHVKRGDTVNRDDPIVTLETDKAAMDVPAPAPGEVAEILVKVGDKVSEGSGILTLKLATEEPVANIPKHALPPIAPTRETVQASATHGSERNAPPPAHASFAGVYASPSVRMLARELSIDLARLAGTGKKGRITKDDLKHMLSGAAPPSSMGIPEIPAQDFAKFGRVETKALSRLKRLSGPHLHRAWLNIPHVTHADEADITDLESYRRTLDVAAKEKGYRMTLLAFLMKASVVALKEYPEFNATLAPDKESLILKYYYNLGVAVDTPDGLVVPVFSDVDRKGILELSQELGTVSARMRDGKIAPTDIQGGTFSISSLGGIGGTGFTPIVNAPEVAILGIVRAALKPKWHEGAFLPRLMLPLCLSYDHRVIDGALAARFVRRLADVIEDIRQLVL